MDDQRRTSRSDLAPTTFIKRASKRRLESIPEHQIPPCRTVRFQSHQVTPCFYEHKVIRTVLLLHEFNRYTALMCLFFLHRNDQQGTSRVCLRGQQIEVNDEVDRTLR